MSMVPKFEDIEASTEEVLSPGLEGEFVRTINQPINRLLAENNELRTLRTRVKTDEVKLRDTERSINNEMKKRLEIEEKCELLKDNILKSLTAAAEKSSHDSSCPSPSNSLWDITNTDKDLQVSILRDGKRGKRKQDDVRVTPPTKSRRFNGLPRLYKLPCRPHPRGSAPERRTTLPPLRDGAIGTQARRSLGDTTPLTSGSTLPGQLLPRSLRFTSPGAPPFIGKGKGPLSGRPVIKKFSPPTSSEEDISGSEMSGNAVSSKTPTEEGVLVTSGSGGDEEMDTMEELREEMTDDLTTPPPSYEKVDLESVMVTPTTPPLYPVLPSAESPLPLDLPGVEVLARTTIIVTNSPQTVVWEGYGFKLTIPQGSLPAGIDRCQLDIVASVAGQYKFPDNLQLVSGIFWVRPHPLCRFQQQLTVEIQHCAKMTSSTKLSFVRACCSQKHLPYPFKAVGRQYRKKRAVLEQYSALEFEKDRISLKIEDASGWEIKALVLPLIITKSEVDVYTGRGNWIPALQLQANRLEKKANLECTLKVDGAIRPTQLNISIPFSNKSDEDSQERSSLDNKRTCTDDQGKENQLSTNDLAEVLSELMDANNQWYNLGLMLGVQYGTLKGIKSTENDIQDCLREMLAHWLESSSSHTWRDICNALRSNTVKQGNLADTIEEKKCKSIPRSSSRSSSGSSSM